jgi:hypothetical protein
MRVVGLVICWSLLSAAFVLFVKYGYLYANFDPGRLEGAYGIVGLLGILYLILTGAVAAVGILSAVAIFFLNGLVLLGGSNSCRMNRQCLMVR